MEYYWIKITIVLGMCNLTTVLRWWCSEWFISEGGRLIELETFQ